MNDTGGSYDNRGNFDIHGLEVETCPSEGREFREPVMQYELMWST
ncbi:hypothetical protein [uncultured Rubinisphaera sp.]